MKRLIPALLLMISLVACTSKPTQVTCPPMLQPGDTIALFCPASYLYDSASIFMADSVLQSWGYATIHGTHLCDGQHMFAGTTEFRKAELLDFLRNPSIRALFCLRGGWGSVKQMMEIPADTLRKYPKLLIGYSDITSMHWAWCKAGLMSIHGPMGVSFLDTHGNSASDSLLRAMMQGERPNYHFVRSNLDSLPANRPGHVSGRLIGGNVETMRVSFGTHMDLLANDEPLILFIEEVNGDINALERIFLNLQYTGMKSHIKAIVCCQWTDTPLRDNHTSVEEMLDEVFASWNIPVVYEFPVGHNTGVNYPLLHGAEVTLDVTPSEVTLEYN